MYMAGIDPTQTWTGTAGDVPSYGLGDVVFNKTSQGIKGYMLILAGGAITGDAYICDIDGSSYSAVMCTTTTTAPGTGQGKSVGVARAAIASGSYGWVQVFGFGLVRTLASAAAYTNLNSTATAGALDDDATAGAEVIEGIVLDVAQGGATGNQNGWINWPRVGRTL